MLPLSLSYDHRVIDGADAMRFLRWVADALEQPFLLTLHG
jgi:pyruvate dehydrogenase E2 component (dihydrolipoamide acetyltransferase)